MQWIFLLEGVFTICFSLFSFWILPNNPLDVKTLSPTERQCLVQHLLLDAKGTESIAIIPRQILSILKDTNMWLVVLVLFSNSVSFFGLAYFTPSIIAGFRYSANKTQLYTVPPFAIAFVATIISALVADQYKAQEAVSIVCTLHSVISFASFSTSKTIRVRYASLCFLITGVYATAPCLITWLANNTAAHTRRVTTVAIGFMSTNAGGIVSAWLYPKSSAPNYKFAAKFNLALNCFMLVGMALNILLLMRRN
jgi:predicted MFS family arabinose efflux permease